MTASNSSPVDSVELLIEAFIFNDELEIVIQNLPVLFNPEV
jgi:hypothetical protein